MTVSRWLWTALIPALLFLGRGPAAQQAPAASPPLHELMHDVHALHELHRLRLSTAQLRGLLKSLDELQAQRRAIEGKHDTPEVRAALLAVRKALQEGREPDELGPLFERLEQLRAATGREEQEPEAQIDAAVRRTARSLLQSLRAEQVIRLVGNEGEERDGLAHRLVQEVREVSRAPEPARRRWSAERSLRLSLELTEDTTRSGRARAELQQLFDRLLKEPGLPAPGQPEKVEEELGGIISRAVGSPLGEIQLRAERRLAELLRHPRLASLVRETLAIRGEG